MDDLEFRIGRVILELLHEILDDAPEEQVHVRVRL